MEIYRSAAPFLGRHYDFHAGFFSPLVFFHAVIAFILLLFLCPHMIRVSCFDDLDMFHFIYIVASRMLQFGSRDAFEHAIKEIGKKGRLYRLEKVMPLAYFMIFEWPCYIL